MSVSGPEAEMLRIDVTGNLAVVTLVEQLRWARPRVEPLAGSNWQICIPCQAARDRVLTTLRAWLCTQELDEIMIWVAGETVLVAR